MIVLHTFGPFMGTADSSPFVMKAMMLLKLARLDYREARGNPLRAPRGFLPLIEDDGQRIGDSTLIRWHIERKYGVDFDAGLSQQQRAHAWAIERLCEDHLYFALLDFRWRDARNFANGLGKYMFSPIPAPVRPLVKRMMIGMNRKRLRGHGLGRHDGAVIAELARRDIAALAAILGDKPWLMGDSPSGADATVYGLLAAILIPELVSPVRDALRDEPRLVAYVERVTDQVFRAPTTPWAPAPQLRVAVG